MFRTLPRLRWPLFAPLAFLVLRLSVVAAQPPRLPGVGGPIETRTPPAPAGDRPEDLRTKRLDVAQRIVAAQRVLDSVKGDAAVEPKPSEQLSHEVELLKQLDMLYAQQQSAEELRKETETNKVEAEQKLSSLRRDGSLEKRPYSFLLLDSLRDNLLTQQSRANTIEAALTAATDSLNRAKATYDQREAERRRTKEAAEKIGNPAKAGESANQLKVAELEANVAKQTVSLRQAELANAKSMQQLHSIQLTLLQETLASMEKDVVFSEDDLHTVLVDIEKQETDLKQELHAAELSLDYFDHQWTDTREKLDTAAQSTPALREEERARKLARDCQMRRTTLTQKQLEQLGPLRQAWRRRFELASAQNEHVDLMAWKKDCEKNLEQLGLERRLEELQAGETRKELADLEKRLQQTKDQDPELARWIGKEIALYQQLIESHSTNLIRLETHIKLHTRLLDEIRAKTERRSLADWLMAGWHSVAAIWNYELTSFDDQSVTVGKVCTGILLLFCGVFLSRRITKVFARRVLPRAGIHDGAAVAVESLAFYALVVTTVLMALHMINVPLTVFTFMGGAVAIGVGFGSQNILNNFISGVILLIERPIRVGDMIEVGSLYGTVEHIGMRSTRIRTGTNLEIIVPNSSFLEGNVVNWTLSDTTVRCSVRVGIAYGSPTRDAARWLKRAADEHGLVLKKPESFVWFADFADNSLTFELHFWIGIRTLADRRRIESDLRFIIDQYFREAGIIIAFPQREVHLDTTAPLEVRMLPNAGSGLNDDAGNKKVA